MLELSGLPKKYHAAVFNTPSGATALGWQSWTKPRGFTMCMMHVVGGGGAGGNGFTRAAGNAGGGGGGGGGGGLCKLLLPMAMLPNGLSILVGAGGTATGNGVGSYVSILPNTTARNVLIVANGGTGGGTGTGGAGGGAGGGGSATTAPNARLSACGFFYTVAGAAGGAGDATTTGANGNAMTTGSGTSGGAGGAGVTSGNVTANGGQVAGGEWLYSIAGGVAPSGRGNDGLLVTPPNCADGVNAYIPTLSLSGSGGASGGTVVGGNGGDGGPGSGGGGGGAGTTGGTGGRGGDGFVVIICW
jgi:hypothetical protein